MESTKPQFPQAHRKPALWSYTPTSYDTNCRANPKFGPVLLGKIDLADRYYRIPLTSIQAMQLACLLPSLQEKNPCCHPTSVTNGLDRIPTLFLCCDGNHCRHYQHILQRRTKPPTSSIRMIHTTKRQHNATHPSTIDPSALAQPIL
jgi:hypothetical protein